MTSSHSAPGGARRYIARACEWLNAPAELCVLLMMLHMLADVIVRALFGAGLEGMVESVTYLYMVGIAFLPVAALEAQSAHLRVEMLAERASPRVARAMHGLARLATVVVAGAMAWLTFEKAWEAWLIRDHVELTHWSLPTWPAQWVFPIGFGAMALGALSQLLPGATPEPDETEPPREVV